MKKFRDVFKNKHVFLPVVHVATKDQALENVRVARDNGADGVFLINHVGSAERLMEAYSWVRRRHKDWWIGLNLLGLNPKDAIRYAPASISGLWLDDVGYREDVPDPTENLEALLKFRKEHASWRGLLFGGVAFKYQVAVRDVGLAASIAAQYVDVLTTSGNATGSAPDTEKIRKMRQAIGSHPLAIASGISLDNIYRFLPDTDCFLVSSSLNNGPVTYRHDSLQPKSVMALAGYIHSAR